MSEKKTVLLVEDETSVRNVLFKKLTQRGYRVISSSLISEARSFILSSLKIDLTIVDLKLPDGDGINLLPEIKEFNPHAETIILTGYGTIELAVSASKQGAFQFVTKPFDLSSFMSLVDRALTHSSLVAENKTLKSHLKVQESDHDLIGKSQEISHVVKLAKRVADSDSTVLISGESGTGKELIARMIHKNSSNGSGPFIAVNCGALSEDLLESELFGHKKGSFTGAIDDRKGRFCLANNGTLFLDEIGDMSPRLQVKVLRAIQERSYEPIGGHEAISSNARIVAATHKNLEKLVRSGSFREDLFYRLNVIPLQIPSLRERKTDIPLLVHHFVKKFNKEKNRQIEGVTKKAFDFLMTYSWPGNIRELENLFERLAIVKSNGLIEVEDLPRSFYSQSSDTKTTGPNCDVPSTGIDFNTVVSEFEDCLILKALEMTGWNKNKAAHLLGLNRTTLVEKIKKKGFQKPKEFEKNLDPQLNL